MSSKHDTIRIAVIENGRQLSGIWRIWRRNDDVYVAPRAIASSYKVSLHQSGRFRFGFTSDEKAKRFLAAGQDRAVYKWTGPTSENSPTPLLQILFPEAELLAPLHKPKLPSPLVGLQIPKPGDVSVVTLLQTKMLPSNITEITTEMYEVRTLARWDLTDSRQIWITEHQETPSPEFSKGVEQFQRTVPTRFQLNPSELPDRQTSHLRTFVSMDSPDGIMRFVDLCAEHIREVG